MESEISETVGTESEVPGCRTAGCSGELCISIHADSMDSVCVLKCENGCRRFQNCGQDASGECVWTTKENEDEAYQDCLRLCDEAPSRNTDGSDAKEEAPAMCICTAEYNPICCSGKQHSSPCNAECDGVSKPAADQEQCTTGECSAAEEVKWKKCACQKIYHPICCNGNTYSNECMAVCHGISRP